MAETADSEEFGDRCMYKFELEVLMFGLTCFAGSDGFYEGLYISGGQRQSSGSYCYDSYGPAEGFWVEHEIELAQEDPNDTGGDDNSKDSDYEGSNTSGEFTCIVAACHFSSQ